MEILTENQILGVIGGGNMAQAILYPLFEKNLIDPGKVIVSATSEKTLDTWRKFGCKTSFKNENVIESSDIIMWAVKPQIFPIAVDQISKNLINRVKPMPLNLSIMAGITLEQFISKLQTIFQNSTDNFRAIRTMPNIGLQVSCGVCVFTGAERALDDDKIFTRKMFQPIGLCYEVQESQINGYNGLSGSGIGFMMPLLEAMSDGGEVGLPRAISLEISAQVMKGAAELYLKTRKHPGELKDMVCSPGGTTIAGISELEKGGVRSSIINAIEAATVRGQELGALAKSLNK